MSYSQALEMQLSLLSSFTEGGLSEAMFPQAGNKAAFIEAAVKTTRNADPYYWAPELCDLISVTSASLPSYTLRQDDLPSTWGYCWFPRAMPLTPAVEQSDTNGDMRGFLWWADPSPDIGVWAMGLVDAPGWPAGAPGCCGMWNYGEDYLDLTYQVVPDGAGFGPSSQARTIEQMQIIATCFAFMQQRILVTHQERAQRATRKRAAAGLPHEPLIKVVILRRSYESNVSSAETDNTEWACRWIVRGHWRQQFHPSDDSHRPLFIMPYVKGPEDKPLKPPRAKVFAVVR